MWVTYYEHGTLYSQSSESTYSFFLQHDGGIHLVSANQYAIGDLAEWHNMDDIPDAIQHRIECIVNAL